MYAIIETGGKQYRVLEGDSIYVEKLAVNPDETVTIDKVVALGTDEGELKVGAPYLEGAKVVAKAIKNGKGKKALVFKYKSKKNERKLKGHRQPYTLLTIETIEA